MGGWGERRWGEWRWGRVDTVGEWIQRESGYRGRQGESGDEGVWRQVECAVHCCQAEALSLIWRGE